MVRMAVEDRGLSQDPEVRLQSGGIEAQNSRTLGKIDRGLLHSELARVLDDDVERSATEAPPDLALTDMEIRLLDHLVKEVGKNCSQAKTLSHYLNKIARLGGYLARASDPPPGNMVMWRRLCV
jgi:hypothetical protein